MTLYNKLLKFKAEWLTNHFSITGKVHKHQTSVRVVLTGRWEAETVASEAGKLLLYRQGSFILKSLPPRRFLSPTSTWRPCHNNVSQCYRHYCVCATRSTIYNSSPIKNVPSFLKVFSWYYFTPLLRDQLSLKASAIAYYLNIYLGQW